MIVATYNYIKTGNPFKAGIPLEDFSGKWWAGITEPIWGIDKGIIWSNPWLIPAVIITVILWRHLSSQHRQILAVLLFLFSASIAIYANWVTWAGDHTYGARFQVHLVPALAVLLGSSVGLFGNRLWRRLALLRKQLGQQFKVLPQPNCQPKLNNKRNTKLKAPKFQAKLSLLVLTVCVLLQIPSISLIHNLEICQAIRAGLWQNNTTVSPTQYLPQIPHRYKNFWLKLTTQAAVLPLPPAIPITGDSRRQFLISDQDFYGAQRWNFWPWLSAARLKREITQILSSLWYILVAVSVSLWLLLAGWATQTTTDT